MEIFGLEKSTWDTDEISPDEVIYFKFYTLKSSLSSRTKFFFTPELLHFFRVSPVPEGTLSGFPVVPSVDISRHLNSAHPRPRWDVFRHESVSVRDGESLFSGSNPRIRSFSSFFRYFEINSSTGEKVHVGVSGSDDGKVWIKSGK